jgi:hypothetical protein
LVQEAIRDKAKDELCGLDPLEWLQHYTKTRDDHWREKGTDPYCEFPKLPYMPKLFELMASSRRLFLPKSREMMLSWAVVGYAVHLCQWHPNIQVIIQSEREAKSVDLVVGHGVPGYARVLWEKQDDFLKHLHALTKSIEDMPADVLSWANGSSIRGVPSGANQVRQYHPSLFIMDEAAFLSEAAASYDTAEPVSSQIFVISTAGPGWFAEVCQNIMENCPPCTA